MKFKILSFHIKCFIQIIITHWSFPQTQYTAAQSQFSGRISREMNTWKAVKVLREETAQQASEKGRESLLLNIPQPDCVLKITTVHPCRELTE